MLLALLTAAAFELVRLDDGVFAALVQPDPPSYAFANSLVVIDDEAVTVVDTQQSPAAAETLIAEIRALTDKPVRFVVNTHWHGDHVYGNQVYRRHFPDVVFIAHASVRGDLLDAGAGRLAEERASLPKSIEDRRRWLATNTGPSGEPLTDELRRRVETSLRLRSDYAAELETLELIPPDVDFAEKLVLHRPGRTIELLHFGRAHTRGDTVVFLPEAGIAAVGDLVEDAFPYFGDSFPGGWSSALDRIRELGASILVPSHGPVFRDTEVLDLQARFLERLVDEVRAAVAAGRTLEEAQASVTLEEFLDAFPNAQDGIRDAVARAYAEAVP